MATCNTSVPKAKLVLVFWHGPGNSFYYFLITGQQQQYFIQRTSLKTLEKLIKQTFGIHHSFYIEREQEKEGPESVRTQGSISPV